jgi:uncharacterized protein YlaI
MQCQVCGATVADELDSYEVVVREVRRRNVPTLQYHVCKQCALAIAHGVERRVAALRKRAPRGHVNAERPTAQPWRRRQLL